jgi:hypothetical protein
MQTHINSIFHESFYGRPSLKQPSGLPVSWGSLGVWHGSLHYCIQFRVYLTLNTHTRNPHIYVGMLIWDIEDIVLLVSFLGKSRICLIHYTPMYKIQWIYAAQAYMGHWRCIKTKRSAREIFKWIHKWSTNLLSVLLSVIISFIISYYQFYYQFLSVLLSVLLSVIISFIISYYQFYYQLLSDIEEVENTR